MELGWQLVSREVFLKRGEQEKTTLPEGVISHTVSMEVLWASATSKKNRIAFSDIQDEVILKRIPLNYPNYPTDSYTYHSHTKK